MTRIGSFDWNQFAYEKEKGARDALAYIVLTWIVALNSRCKIGVYCSDVSGAFDRVSTETLLKKLEAKGIHPFLLKLAASWLQSRKASVLVGGACSETFDLCNMVYQGTALGPILWNIFFSDADKPIREAGFEEAFFDDSNCFKICPARKPYNIVN